MKGRTSQVNVASNENKTFITSKNIKLDARKKFVESYLRSVDMYSTDSWNIAKEIKIELESQVMLDNRVIGKTELEL